MAEPTHSPQESNSTFLSDTTSTSSSSTVKDLVGGKYFKLEDLGVGGYSRVILASDEKTGQLVAIKILLSEPVEVKDADDKVIEIKWEITKSKYKQCKREMELMQKIEHENVVKLVDFIDDKKATFPQKRDNKYIITPCLCVALEYCSKGELFDYLMYAGGLGSRVTRTYFHQFLNGLQAMHNAGYVHRDLKPENLLLDDNYNLKIADFGFATPFKNPQGKILLASTCGTRGYLAPELIKGQKYTNKVDLFAVGIIMFTTFAGFPPFQHAGRGDWWWDKMDKAWKYWQEASQLNSDADKAKKAEKIAKGNQKMKLFWSAHERSCKFSDSFKHLMQYLLNPNPTLRYDIKECFEHPWLKARTLNGRQLKRTMKKHSEKVNKQRAKKIAEQLKTRGMELTDKAGAKRSPFKKPGVKEDLETLLAKSDPLTIIRNTAILNKARFQLQTNFPIDEICFRIESAALLNQAKVTFDKILGEFEIVTAITRSKNAKELFTKSEKIVIKAKIINEKNIKKSEENDEDDKDDDDENFITDSDGDDDDDEDNNNNEKKNEKKTDNNNDNTATTQNKNENTKRDSKTDKETKEANKGNTRYHVVFWRVDGSADGYQRVMAELFYHTKITSLIDLDNILNGDDSQSNSGLNYKTPSVFATVFAEKHTHYASNAETDELPDSLPIPTY